MARRRHVARTRRARRAPRRGSASRAAARIASMRERPPKRRGRQPPRRRADRAARRARRLARQPTHRSVAASAGSRSATSPSRESRVARAEHQVKALVEAPARAVHDQNRRAAADARVFDGPLSVCATTPEATRARAARISRRYAAYVNQPAASAAISAAVHAMRRPERLTRRSSSERNASTSSRIAINSGERGPSHHRLDCALDAPGVADAEARVPRLRCKTDAHVRSSTS